MEGSLISVTEAAARYGLSPEHIRLLVREGTVAAVRFGHTWALDPRSLEAYLATARRRGPKRKKEELA